MCTHRCGLSGGNGRIAEDCLGIARTIRMICKTRGGDTRSRRKNRKRPRMQTLLARLRQGVLERTPGKLVSEGKSAILVAHHSDTQATLDARFIRPRGLLQQPD